MEDLCAGAAKWEIKIPENYPAVENFGVQTEPLWVRAIALEQGELFVLVSLELTSLPEQDSRMIREEISGKLCIPLEHVWLCASHSFSSPHLLPDSALKTEQELRLRDEYRENLRAAAVGAALDAAGRLRNAVCSVGETDCPIVGNRDVELEGGWWIGCGGSGPTDQRVTVLSIEDTEGNKIAAAVHFGMQSSVMDQAQLSDGKKPVTSDVSGKACSLAEEKLGGVVLYLIGAAGDQAPVKKAVTEIFRNGERIRSDLGEKGFEIRDGLAERLAAAILQAAGTAAAAAQPPEKVPEVGRAADTGINLICGEICLPVRRPAAAGFGALKPMRKFVYRDTPGETEPGDFEIISDGVRPVKIWIMRMGTLALLGVKQELNCVTAQAILRGSPFEHTLVCTMVNGTDKYMADEASFRRCTYEAMNSRWNRGAAEKLAEECIRMLYIAL